uniref:LRAT domain-containing protein n=1 Tax=Ditylenchus dipsaci TaxID=166011 RepID=A0A915EMM9_9BILA
MDHIAKVDIRRSDLLAFADGIERGSRLNYSRVSSKWYSNTNELLSEEVDVLAPGDLLEYQILFLGRHVASHWLVYVGVISGLHYVISAHQGDFDCFKVFVEHLEGVDRICRVNNSIDDRFTPREPERIVQTAINASSRAETNYVMPQSRYDIAQLSDHSVKSSKERHLNTSDQVTKTVRPR